MYVGVKIFGVSGFILGPATVIFLKALFKAGVITISATKKE
jgi:predicted PurR-regulated permease PerM